MSDTSKPASPQKPPGLSTGDVAIGLGCGTALGCLWLFAMPVIFLLELPGRWRRKFLKTAYRENKTILQPPFPILSWDGTHSWIGEIHLPEWEGIWEGVEEGRVQPPPERKIGVTVLAPDPVHDALPSEAQGAALSILLENGDETVREVLKAVAPVYSESVREFATHGVELPPIASPSELRNKLQLLSMSILPEVRGERSFASLSLSWLPDPEHGLGLLLHGCEVIDIGTAELCGDQNAARRANTYTHLELGDFIWEDDLEQWAGAHPPTPFDDWTRDITISHWNGNAHGEHFFKLWSKRQREGTFEKADPPELSILRPGTFSPPSAEQLAAIKELSHLPASVDRDIRDRFLAEMEHEEESARDGCPNDECRERLEERLAAHLALGDPGVTRRARFDGALILDSAADGIAFSILSFRVSWNSEHGSCILMHGHHVLAMEQQMFFDDLSEKHLREYIQEIG